MSISKRKRQRVLEKTDGHCAYCGVSLRSGSYHVDHVVPKAHGGSDSEDNLVPACRKCNYLKKDRDPEDYRMWVLDREAGELESMLEQRVGWLIETGVLRKDHGARILAAGKELVDLLSGADLYLNFYFEVEGISVPEWDVHVGEF